MPGKADHKAAERAAKATRIRDYEYALRAALSLIDPTLDLTAKAMFGGAGFFVHGQIMAAWFGEGLTLKLSPDDRTSLLTAGGRESMSDHYIEFPQVWLDDPPALAEWVERALAYSIRR